MTNGTATKQELKAVESPRRGLWPDVDRYFDRLARGFPVPRRLARAWLAEGWFPDIDVFERDDKIVLRADLPGMKSEDIQVALDRDLLTVSGKRHEVKEVKEEEYHCSERSTGEFSRTIRVPEGVVAESVAATYSNGVLEVIVPKPTDAMVRSTNIPVK